MFLSANLTNHAEKVGRKSFELLKVLGTGGECCIYDYVTVKLVDKVIFCCNFCFSFQSTHYDKTWALSQTLTWASLKLQAPYADVRAIRVAPNKSEREPKSRFDKDTKATRENSLVPLGQRECAVIFHSMNTLHV